MESTTTEGAPVAEELVEENYGIGDSRKKNGRDRNTVTTGNSLRVTVPRRMTVPGKISMRTNQIRATAARAHVSRELSAHAPQASPGI